MTILVHCVHNEKAIEMNLVEVLHIDTVHHTSFKELIIPQLYFPEGFPLYQVQLWDDMDNMFPLSL